MGGHGKPREALLLLGIVAMAGVAAILLIITQGGGNTIGAAYTTLGEIPQNYAPPWNPFTNQQFLTLSHTITNGKVNLMVTAETPGMIFYKEFYVSQSNGGVHWEKHTFSQDEEWIRDEASANLTLNTSDLDTENWVIVYACAPVGNEWKCGCYSDTDTSCQKWSIQNFSSCTPDPLCSDRNDGDQFCDNGNVVTCLASPEGCLGASIETCGGGTTCLVSGTDVACASCATSPPDPSTVDCGETAEGTLCDGTQYSVTGERCTTGVCDAGSCVECVAASDCTNPPSNYDDECYTATCTSGSCSYDATNEGGDCTTSSGETGTCQSGACVTSCSDECDPSGFPNCGYETSPPWRIYYETCADTDGDGCYEVDEHYCDHDQYCDESKGGCYDPSCGDGIKQWGEECDDGDNNGQCPAACSSSCTLNHCDTAECNDGADNDGDGQVDYPADTGCAGASDTDETDCGDGVCEGGETAATCPADCNSADGDTSESACQAASDQTTTPAANPPDQEAFDYGKAWLDPWPTGAEGTGNCCGDDANEWLLYDEGNDAIKSCCDAYTDCVDSSGACKTHNALYGDKFCYYDWWYNCNSGTLCMAHMTPSLDPQPTKDCYYQNGAYAWGDYDNPPAENCTDGKDNDCDGDVDGADTDCSVDFFVSKIMTEAFGNSFSSSFCAEPATSLLDGVRLEADVLFSSEGKNGQGTYTFSPGSTNGALYSLADCHGATRQESVGGFDNAPDYITVRITIDKNNQVPEVNENNNEKTVVISLNNAVNSFCGGHGEWPCDAQNHGKWCRGMDATTCGVTCDAGYTFCPDTNGCWISC